jgi:hypothetical protein
MSYFNILPSPITRPSATVFMERTSLPTNLSEALLISKEHKRSKSQPSSLEALPGEIRNDIFELYIQGALKPTRGASWSTTRPAKGILLSILPQWHGPARMRIDGIGPLALLFVNKQIYNELASLVYCRVENLRIGGYIMQHPNDDPTLRFQPLYPLLLNPYICRFTRSIKLKLPSTRDDLHRRHCSLRGFSITGFKGQTNPPKLEAILSVVPGLVECLKSFDSLSNLEIVITTELTNPPDFEPLLPLYDLCGNRTNVVFDAPIEYFGINVYSTWLQWTERWDNAWKNCLARHRGA